MNLFIRGDIQNFQEFELAREGIIVPIFSVRCIIAHRLGISAPSGVFAFFIVEMADIYAQQVYIKLCFKLDKCLLILTRCYSERLVIKL